MDFSSIRAAITVLMPVRNGANFINQSLENLVEITNSRDEILVINDGSTDKTLEILESWVKKCDRLRVISTQPNGLVSALNLGIQEASNKVIARADVDDIYRPDRLEKQLNYLKGNIGLVFSDYKFRNSMDENYGIIPTAIFPEAMSLSLLTSQRTPHPSAMFLKDAVLEVGGYLEDEFLVEDLGLWLRINTKFEIAGCPEVLLDYKLSKNSVSITRREDMLARKDLLLKSATAKWTRRSLTESQISNILHGYADFQFPSRRRLLFLRDLYIANQMGIQKTRKSKILFRFFTGAIKKPEMLLELGLLSFEKMKRKRVR